MRTCLRGVFFLVGITAEGLTRIADLRYCHRNVLSGRLGFREFQHFGLNTLQDGISNKGARTKDLNTN